MELSKREKQKVRRIIETGLQREFSNGLSEGDNILNKWKNKSKNNREAYHLIYKHITDFDNHISRRYDRISGSKYLFIIAGQIRDGVISEMI